MKLLNLILILKLVVSVVYKDAKLDPKKKWVILYEGRAPSKLACVQKALYFKGEGMYEEGKCKVMKEDGGNTKLISTGGYYQKKVGNIDKLTLEWRQTTVIDSKIRFVKNNVAKMIPAFQSEYKVSFKFLLNSYDGVSMLQIHGRVNIPYNMLKFFLRTDKRLGSTYKMNNKYEYFNSAKPIPLNQWYSVRIEQRKVSSFRYVLQTWFDGQLVNTMNFKKAPTWQNSLNIYASYPWKIAADGFVSNIVFYERVH